MASSRLGYVVPLVSWVRENLRPVDVLVVRAGDVPGVERYAARVAVSLDVQVETTTDPVAELARVDWPLVGCADLDAVPAEVLHAATRAGLPAVLHVEGRYPMPQDAESVAAQRWWSQWFAERSRRAAEDARAAVREAAPARRGSGPVSRSGRTMEQARRAAHERRMAGEQEAG